MASYNTYFGTGSQTDFSLTFPYIDKTHVKVSLAGVDTTAWTWFNPSTVRMTVAPASGTKVKVYRATPVSPLVDYVGGAFLSEESLDLSNRQSVYIAEEAIDIAAPLGNDITSIAQAVLDANQIKVDAQTAKTGAETARTAAQVAQAAAEAQVPLAAAQVATLQTQRRVVISRLATPPGSPSVASNYLVIATATGAWAGQENKIATWSGTAWSYTTPATGWSLYSIADGINYDFTGTAWAPLAAAATLVDGSVTNPKLATVATQTIKGRITAGTGAPEDLTPVQARTVFQTGTVFVKSAGYTIASSDIGNTLLCSGTFTLACTAAASLFNGFTTTVRNTGTGVITIDPNASETINGLTTIGVYPGESVVLLCDGTSWTAHFSAAVVKVSSLLLGAATANVDIPLPAEFKFFTLRWTTIEPVTATAKLLMRISLDGGTTFYSTTGNYNWQQAFASTTGSTASTYNSTSGDSSGIEVSIGAQAAASGAQGLVSMLVNPRNTGRQGGIQWDGNWGTFNNRGSGYVGNTTSNYTTLRFLYSAGNIAAGAEYTLYGNR